MIGWWIIINHASVFVELCYQYYLLSKIYSFIITVIIINQILFAIFVFIIIYLGASRYIFVYYYMQVFYV